jgi:CBS domain containing-hemolysin-like protein
LTPGDLILPASLWILLLVSLHALLRFAETALANMRRGVLREREDAGDRRAAAALALAEQGDRVRVTIDAALMMLRFGIAAFAVVDYGRAIELTDEALGFTLPPEAAYLLALLPAVIFTYLLGELLASAFGRTYADQAAPVLVPLLRVLVFAFTPVSAVALAIDRAVARAGGEPLNKAVTEEEIIALVEEGQESGTIEDEEKEMIHSILQFGETIVREIMIPRQDITGIEASEPLEEALKMIVESGHSRIPVYEGAIDSIRGVLYAKDLLGVLNTGGLAQATVRGLMRAAYFVPETKRADMLLQELQQKKIHIALIVDEYGGTAGLVTIEDLIEEIVGDIRDEYDANEAEDYIAVSSTAYVLDGAMNIDDVNELLDATLPTDENDSIGGYIYTVLGRVPSVGDVIEERQHGVMLRVEAVENRRIRKIYAERREKTDAETVRTDEHRAAVVLASAGDDAEAGEGAAESERAPRPDG